VFQFVDDKRRITTFIKSEAHKWLYKNIAKYKPNGAKAEDLYMEISREGFITEKTYDELFSLFENNPFSGTIKGISHRKPITTDDIHMYFVEYNGTRLPIGFIFDFFEDDYGDSDKDKEQKLIKDFLGNAKREVKTDWEGTKYNSKRKVEKTMEELENINAFGWKCYAKYAAWSACLLVLVFSVSYFVRTYNVIDTFRVFTAEEGWEFDRYLDFSILDSFNEEADAAYNNYEEMEIATSALNLEEPFTMSTYLRALALPLVVNVIALIVLLSNIKLFITRTINIVKLSIIKIRLRMHMDVAQRCVNAGGDEMDAFLQELINSFDFATRSLHIEGTPTGVEKMFAQLDKHNEQLEANRDMYDKVNMRSVHSRVQISKALVALAVLIIVVNHPQIANMAAEWMLGFGGEDYL